MHYALCNGLKIYYEITDEKHLQDGRPILFLLPGGPGCNHGIYKTHSKEFETIAHVVYFDPRGCGLSDSVGFLSYTMDHYIADVEALRAHLDIEKICMLGTSYGSMTALGYTIKYPAHLDRLILVAGSPSYHFLEDAKKNLLERGTIEQIHICEKHLWKGLFQTSQDIQCFFDIMASLYSVKAKQNSHSKPYTGKTEIVFSIDPLNYAFRSSFEKFDYTPWLSHISCKTLILSGEEDWINHPNYAKNIAEKVPQALLKIYTNCGHAIAADQHEAYINDVINFIV